MPGSHPARLLKLGDRGDAVAELRLLLRQADRGAPAPCPPVPPPDAHVFDRALERDVRAFQQDRGLVADGVVGQQTARQLEGARWRLGDRTLRVLDGAGGMRGDDVSALQERMVVLGVHAGPVDGIFGPVTASSLRELQRGLGVPADGVCGPVTVGALLALRRSMSGGGDAWALRSHGRVAMAGVSLTGKSVVLDPIPETGAEIVADVTSRLASRLRAVGATVTTTRTALDDARPEADRAALAQAAGADLVLSLSIESHASSAAGGVATYYWGGGRVGQQSAIGERLAGLIQREVVARTDVVDLRSHPCSYDIVRLTRMPAVMITLGYLSNPADAARLGDADGRGRLAEAVLVAVQRLYLAEEDAETGTLNLSDVEELSRRR